MTMQEFKAWFEGFTENMKGTPTQKQWARIQERVGQIDGQALTQEIVYRYWPWYTCSTPIVTSLPLGTTWSNTNAVSTYTIGQGQSVYNALTNIGRKEATNEC